MQDILSSAQAALRALRAAGTDLIIALCHSGIAAEMPQDGSRIGPHDGPEIAAVPLAALPEVDAVIAGHTHRVFPSDQFAPCPAVAPVRGHPGLQTVGKPSP